MIDLWRQLNIASTFPVETEIIFSNHDDSRDVFLCQQGNREIFLYSVKIFMVTVKDRIKRLADARGVGLARVDADLGFGNGTIGKWDKSAPSSDKLQLVADYFEVSVDYLLGREETDNDEIMELREQLRRQPGMRILFDASKNATKEQLLAVAEMIEKWSK